MSIRLRLGLYLLFSLLLMMAVGAYAFSLQNKIEQKIDVVTKTSNAIKIDIEELNISFQKQQNAWAYLLLRGQDPQELYYYLQAFYQQERQTRASIQRLKDKLTTFPETLELLKLFEATHQELGQKYRQAMRIYNQSDEPLFEADKYVWDASEDPVNLIESILASIDTQTELLLREENLNREKVLYESIITLLVIIVIATMIFIWLFDRNYGRPLSRAIHVANKISHGDLQTRVSEEMTGDFLAFSKAFNRMIDNLTDTNANLQEHMTTLQEEIKLRKSIEYELIEKRRIAESASKAKSEFLSNVSHEIRTPLNVVLGFSELLARTDMDEKQQRYIKSIMTGGNTLLNLINDVLDLAKIESGKLSLSSGLCDLRALMQEMYDIFWPQAQDKSLAFELHYADEVPDYIIIDEQRVKQILMNLLSNAIKFTEKGSVELHIKCQTNDDKEPDLIFQISDTGIGIPEEFHVTIFEQFEQMDGQDSRRYGGTGLGLAIAKKLAHLLGGTLSLTSSINQGSTFTFRLNAIEVSGKRNKIDATELQDLPTLPSATILIADDIESNRELLVDLLADQPITIIQASDGAMAVSKTFEHDPDMILMDLKMPDKDGIEATREIRANPYFSKIPIIAVTASSIKGADAQAKESLFNAYLTKPIYLSQLLNTMNDLLEKSH